MAATERILIIEHSEEAIRFLTESILNPGGYETLVATDAQKALRQAVVEQPDLILLDSHMPGMPGLEYLRALHDTGPAIPVILMGFYGSEEIPVETFGLGVRTCVIKPFKPQEVLEAVEDALRESRLRREKRLLTEELIRANKQLDQRVRELTMLYDITQGITTLEDLETLLSRVVDTSVFVTKADEGVLFLIDAETGDLYLRAARGVGERRARVLLLPAADSLIGQVVKTGEPLRIASSKARADFTVKTGYMVNSLLYVPLKLRGEIKGVLGVSNRISDRAFTRIDQRRLDLLADHVVIALENARLYETTGQLATDTLRQTLASMSQHVHEPLKAFATNTYALKASAEKGDIFCADGTLDQLLNSMERRIAEMASLTEVLNELASPEDWQNLKQRFGKLKAKHTS